MSSTFSKSSVFFCPHVHTKTAFSKRSTLENVFEKFRFHRYVWTKVVSVKKKLRFQMKTDTCGQGLNLVNRKLSKIERGLHVKILDSAPFTVRP